MAIQNVAANNTFTEWYTRTNAITVEMNRLLEGAFVSTGNLVISGTTVTGTVTLDVTAGSIRSDRIELGTGSPTSPSLTNKGTGNSNTGIYFPSTNAMAFVTGSNVNIHINSSGNVGIGHASPTTKLDVLGRMNVTGITVLTGNVGIFKAVPTVELDVVGSIFATGNISMESDITTKTNIEPLYDALNIVSKLNGVSYNKISTGDRQIGFIAQDVQKILPEVVMKNGETLGINYPVMVSILVEAIKELKDKIDKWPNI